MRTKTESQTNVLEPRKRNLTGSLEQAKDELSDAFMAYKDLEQRCTIDFKNIQTNGQVVGEEDENPFEQSETPLDSNSISSNRGSEQASAAKKTKVFYFKPETFLLSDPDKQRQFREKLLSQIKAVPQLTPPRLMADDLQESLIDAVADRSDPAEMRKVLATYFKRKQYSLQHKRYKLMLRWAHHAIRTRNIEQIGQQATFRCSKLQWEIDNAIKRGQRLEVDDDYTMALYPELRPTSRAKKNEGTLYVEIKDLPPQSCIREDDIEVYSRHMAYAGKINKLVNKYMARLKWLPLSRRFTVFDSMVSKYFDLREKSLQKQRDLLALVEKTALEDNLKTQELMDELREIKRKAHITHYENSMADQKERIKGSCRPDYVLPPDLLDNVPLIKIKIKDLAQLYGLSADLNQDNGFSFAYQLTLFFPTYFQKLVIKSEFSIYDAFAGQNEDENHLKKRNFSSMLRVDPGIFKDVATNQNLVPSEESLADEVTRLNIKVIRLKGSSWTDHISMAPKLSDWQKRQDALLFSEENPADTLLSGALDFLDVNDLASVNLVIAEASQIHMEIVNKKRFIEERERKAKVHKKFSVQDQQVHWPGEEIDPKTLNQVVEKDIYQTVSATNIHELNNNLYVAMSNALTGGNIIDQKKKQLEEFTEISQMAGSNLSKTSLFNLPQHLIISHNTLRYMNSRELKTKILYSLNYFRSIQKRIMLDLREFGTRERILGDVADPLIPASEADPQIIDTLNIVLSNTNKAFQAAEDGQLHLDEEVSGTAKLNKAMTRRRSQLRQSGVVTDPSKLRELLEKENTSKGVEKKPEEMDVSLVDLKKMKLRGKFHTKTLTTCPVLPRYHATFGEPSEHQPEFVERDQENQKEEFISKASMKLLNRMDHVEIDEVRQEVFVKDDFSIYIMYDCTLIDMQSLEKELVRIGSFYITRMEELYDTETDKVCYRKDRQQVLNDLLACEMEFQFKKVLLTQLYLECYDHICDPVEQQRLAQIIINTMARRPRLNLESLYFEDSYRAELENLDRHIKLLNVIINNQIHLEKTENTNLHESLNLSYSLAQKKEKDCWDYEDADKYLQGLIDKFKEMQAEGAVNLSETQDSDGSDDTRAQEMLDRKRRDKAKQKKKEEEFQPGFQMRNMRYTDFELDSEAFTKLLGLPKVTLEQLFKEGKENDEVVLDIMNEQCHFVNLIEGYPDLMSLKQSGKSTQATAYKNEKQDLLMTPQQSVTKEQSLLNTEQLQELNIRFNAWQRRSVAMSIMDFYEDSLVFVTKLESTISSCVKELVDVHKPHDNTMAILLEAAILEEALAQYREMKDFMIGEKTEHEGHEYLESESVVGSSDKMMFYIKDLVADLERPNNEAQNPFIVAKLDLDSIKAFRFPSKLKIDQNPYTLKMEGLHEGKATSIAIAEQIFQSPSDFNKNIVQMDAFRKQERNKKATERRVAEVKLKPPTVLHLQCNAMELLRMRKELLMCMSECVELQQLYKQQVKQCNRASLQPLFSESLSFEQSIMDDNELNYFDDGPASMLNLGLAIAEIDPAMASNLNFRSADAFKILITNSGLEEMRLVLHYQVMQKQALIVACRTNQAMMDTHFRAVHELQFVRKGYALPNMVIPFQSLFTRISDGIDNVNFNRVKSLFSSNLNNNISNSIFSVGQWKSTLRTNVGKRFQDTLASCEKHFLKREMKLRAMRSYKVNLFHQYCNQVLEVVYANSIKYDLITQCQRLRTLNQYFQFSPALMGLESEKQLQLPKFSQLFDLETNEMIENYTDWYQPMKHSKEVEEFKRQLAQPSSAYNQQSAPEQAVLNLINKKTQVESIDLKSRQLVDVFSIPSSSTLMKIDALGCSEERANVVTSHLEDVKIDFQNNEVEGTELFDQILPNLKNIQSLEEQQKHQEFLPKRRKLHDYSRLTLGHAFKYFYYIEKLICLELTISKVAFSPKTVIDLDHSVQSGLPFFQTLKEMEQACTQDLTSIINSGKPCPDITATQAGKNLQAHEDRVARQQDSRNQLATRIMGEIVRKRRTKSDLGEELLSVAQRIRDVLAESKAFVDKSQEKSSFNSEFLSQFCQQRYLQIVAQIQKLSEQYYTKDVIGAGQTLNETLLALAKRDHIKLVSANGTFHLNQTDLDHERLPIENSNYFPREGNLYEQMAFSKCVFPVLSDKMLEPPEITLLESIYLTNQKQTLVNMKRQQYPSKEQYAEGGKYQTEMKGAQFAGAANFLIPFNNTDLAPLQTNLLCMTNKQRNYISSNLRQMDSLISDYLELIVSEVHVKEQKVLNYQQIKKSKRYLTDQIEARLLKQAIMCFIGHEVPSKLNSDPAFRAKINDIFLKEYFWKVLQEKDIMKEAQDARYNTTMTEQEMKDAQKNLQDEITRLKQIDERKITDEDLSKAQKLKVKAMEEEMKAMKRKVMMDSILTQRSEIVIYQAEIQRYLIQAAVRVLDNETSALANCLKNQSKEVDAYVHPFQQFAVTLYDKVDPLSHLDSINKCQHLQQFMTRLKNRGTQVETLTSGEGYVFTLKDINDCVSTLSKGLLKYAEQELRSRSEISAKREQHYLDLLYVKDQKIESLERRLQEQTRIVDKMVNSRMYEKGNQIVYELDQANRSLKMIKDNVYLLEERVREEIDQEYKSKLNHRETILFKEMRKFSEFKTDFIATMNAGVVEDQEKIKKVIKMKAEEFKNLDQPSPGKYLLPRPSAHDTKNLAQFVKRIDAGSSRRMLALDSKQLSSNPHQSFNNGTISEEDEERSSGSYRFPKKLQDIYKMSEMDARNELALLCDRTRLMFVFWKVKEITMKQKFEDRIQNLNKKLSSNGMLWEQLAESEKREHLLRRELVMTQQNLSNCEKVIEKQREYINKLDTEKVRLQNFKQNKGKRLDELEQKVSQYEIFEKVNVEKLIALLNKQQSELDSLRTNSKNFDQQMDRLKKQSQAELRGVLKKFKEETQMKNKAILTMENMRQEIKSLDMAATEGKFVSPVWKDKCKELFQISSQLREENEYLADRCRQLADMAVGLLYKAQDGQSARLLPGSKFDQSTYRFEETDGTKKSIDAKNIGIELNNDREDIELELQESLKLMQSKQSLLNATQQKRTYKQEVSLPKLASPHDYKGDMFSNFGAKSVNKRYGDPFRDQVELKNQKLIQAAQRKKAASKGAHHSRGRSLLDIKREVDRKDKVDKATQQASTAVFGVSLNREPLHSRNLSRDSVNFVNGPNGPSGQEKQANQPTSSLSQFPVNASTKLRLTKDMQDSMMDSSIKSQRAKTKVGGFQLSTHKGFQGIFGNSSLADYNMDVHMTSQIEKNFEILGHQHHITHESHRKSLTKMQKKSDSDHHSFYNMKASLGIANLYPDKAVHSQKRSESRQSHPRNEVFSKKAKMVHHNKDLRALGLNEVVITGAQIPHDRTPKTNTLLKSQHDSSNNPGTLRDKTGVSPQSMMSNPMSSKGGKELKALEIKPDPSVTVSEQGTPNQIFEHLQQQP